jgi:hypothetical protein
MVLPCQMNVERDPQADYLLPSAVAVHNRSAIGILLNNCLLAREKQVNASELAQVLAANCGLLKVVCNLLPQTSSN